MAWTGHLSAAVLGFMAAATVLRLLTAAAAVLGFVAATAAAGATAAACGLTAAFATAAIAFVRPGERRRGQRERCCARCKNPLGHRKSPFSNGINGW
jgi:hypothetical protein